MWLPLPRSIHIHCRYPFIIGERTLSGLIFFKTLHRLRSKYHSGVTNLPWFFFFNYKESQYWWIFAVAWQNHHKAFSIRPISLQFSVISRNPSTIVFFFYSDLVDSRWGLAMVLLKTIWPVFVLVMCFPFLGYASSIFGWLSSEHYRKLRLSCYDYQAVLGIPNSPIQSLSAPTSN